MVVHGVEDEAAVRGWSERWERPGWTVHYTNLGGRLRRDAASGEHAHSVSAAVENALRRQDIEGVVRRLTSQVMVAVERRGRDVDVDSDVELVSAVLLTLAQRGIAPPAAPELTRAIAADVDGGEIGAATQGQWLAAAEGPMSAFELDSVIDLDGTYERRFWHALSENYPRAARFMVPQAPLESLSGQGGAGESRRWVDFALCSPRRDRTIVVEIDGAQHADDRDVDAARDRELTNAGCYVQRVGGDEALDSRGVVWRGLSATERLHEGEPDPRLVRLLHGPAVPTRLVAALALLLHAGHLSGGTVWDLDIVDDLGVALDALPTALDLLAAVAAVWSTRVAPVEVRAAGHTWRLHDDVYVPGESQPAAAAQRARVVLEPFVPPHAALPTRVAGRPSVVMRGAFVPTHLAWLPTSPPGRRDVDTDDPRVVPALRTLVRQLFGHDELRPGQEQALLDALGGRDACILLPTGSGKSLIYQLAGLLRPGTTLVVDPIVSLIDDQVRRLRNDGIDRVVGLHATKLKNSEIRDATYRAVSAGDALFAFLTPERLQSPAFRDALGAAAGGHAVGLVVVDEAHCVSEWGHDFRTAYLRVGRNLRRLCAGDDDVPPPLLALTGTASPAVLRDLVAELEGTEPMVVRQPRSHDRPNLHYHVITTRAGELRSGLRSALDATASLADAGSDGAHSSAAVGGAGIVFVPHVNGRYGLVDVRSAVADILPDAGLEHVGMYSGQAPKGWDSGRWAAVKASSAAAFLDDEHVALVATKAFGMGIDKPNVRWTVHVGFPSSIESFAQEAGRAGRDGERADCVLVVTPPNSERARLMLDSSVGRERRLAVFHADRADDDLQRQYFFLSSSFPGVDKEFEDAAHMLDQLLAHRPGARVNVARARYTARGASAVASAAQRSPADQEKALYRLMLVGIVDDYTVDHGAGRFVVDTREYTADVMDDSLLAFAERVDPGRWHQHRARLGTAPAPISERARHHLRVLLELLYGKIERGRLQALRGMHDLAVGGGTGEQIRESINAYLTAGPITTLLHESITEATFDMRAFVSRLDDVSAVDPGEWIGAGLRQLESFPDHPAPLFVRALGEALWAGADEESIEQHLVAAITAAASFGVAAEDTSQVLRWAAAHLRNRRGADLHTRIELLFEAWERSGMAPLLLSSLEEDALAAAPDRMDSWELAFVLARRSTRHAADIVRLTDRLALPDSEVIPA